jgi:hypothetical protein
MLRMEKEMLSKIFLNYIPKAREMWEDRIQDTKKNSLGKEQRFYCLKKNC